MSCLKCAAEFLSLELDLLVVAEHHRRRLEGEHGRVGEPARERDHLRPRILQPLEEVPDHGGLSGRGHPAQELQVVGHRSMFHCTGDIV